MTTHTELGNEVRSSDLFFDLLEALKPFANEAGNWDRQTSDRAVLHVSLSNTDPQSTRIVVGDLHFAAKTYRRAKSHADFLQLMAKVRPTPPHHSHKFLSAYPDSFAA